MLPYFLANSVLFFHSPKVLAQTFESRDDLVFFVKLSVESLDFLLLLRELVSELVAFLDFQIQEVLLGPWQMDMGGFIMQREGGYKV